MRSVFALGAAAWLLVFAVLLGEGRTATIGDPPDQSALGDPVVMTVYLVSRILFVGLALIALALAEWGRIGELVARRPVDG